MIPYDELVAALTSWRERQGLPVRREALFDMDASVAPLGVDVLAPLTPEVGHDDALTGAADPDTSETRLETADVVALGNDETLAGLDGDDDGESTFIGSSPAWSDADDAGEKAPDESPWNADEALAETAWAVDDAVDQALSETRDPALAETSWPADDATGESPMAPPRDDTHGEVDAADAQPASDAPAIDAATGDEAAPLSEAPPPPGPLYDEYADGASNIGEPPSPWDEPAADAGEHAAAPQEPPSPWDDAPGESSGEPTSTGGAAIVGEERPVAVDDGAIVGEEQPIAVDDGAIVGEEQPVAVDDGAILGEEQPVAVDDGAILGEEDDGATAIRDPLAEDGPPLTPPAPDELPGGGQALDVDVGDILESSDDEDPREP